MPRPPSKNACAVSNAEMALYPLLFRVMRPVMRVVDTIKELHL